MEQQRCKEAVEADNAANNAALAENLAKARSGLLSVTDVVSPFDCKMNLRTCSGIGFCK